MRLITFLLVFFATTLNAQITVNAPGVPATITVNKPGAPSTITVNRVEPVIPSAIAVSKQQINLVWGEQTGAQIYIIERATDALYTDAQPIYAGVDLRFANTGLAQGIHYYYRLFWSDDATTQTLFAEVDATTLNAGITYDIDAEAYIAAVSPTVVLDADLKTAINNFVTASKTNGLWTKGRTFHLRKFADWSANSLNLFNPNFEIEGFPEIYSGEVDHVNGKAAYAGVSNASEDLATRAFSTDWLVPLNYLGQDDKGYTVNITDAPNGVSGSDQFRFGSTESSSGDAFTIIGKPAGISANESSRMGGANDGTINWMDENIPGLYVTQRSGAASGDVLFRKNSVSLLTSLNASTGNVDLPIATAGQYSNAPVTNSLSFKTFGSDLFAAHESFDATEMTNWENSVNALLAAFDAKTFTPTTPFSTDCRFLRFFGDSFTRWPSSGASSGERGWWVRLGQRFHILPITHAIGSVGYYSQANASNSNSETPSVDRVAVLCGYNDVKVFGTNANGIEHGKSGIRTIIVNQFLASAVPASDASVIKTGIWGNPSLTGSKAAKLGGNALQAAEIGAKLEFTFTGDNVVIGVCNADGSTVTYGSVAIEVDNVSQGSYSANNKAYNVTSSGGRIWNPIVLKGFGPGSHTVEITTESAVNFVVDYFGNLQDPSLCLPILIGDIQYDATGTANRNANADNLTTVIKAMIATEFPEYAAKIAFAATNTYYDLSNVSGDTVHPLDAGYLQIYRAFERVWIY